MGVVWLTYTNPVTSVPLPEQIMIIDNSGDLVGSNGIPIFITTPVQVVDNAGDDVTAVIL